MRRVTLGPVLLGCAVVGLAYGQALGALGRTRTQTAAKPASGLTPIDACKLLTKQEAAAAIGEAVGEPTSSKMAGLSMAGIEQAVSSCEYQSPATIHRIHINVYHSAPAAAPQLRQLYGLVCAKKEPVAGLGDLACWYNPKHGELQVLKGSTFLIITLSQSGDASEALKSSAKKMIDRLP